MTRHLVLVHGLGSDHHYWDNILPELADAFDAVTAVDLPGHGTLGNRPPSGADAHPKALAAAVAARLAAESISEPHLVGHSLGGWVALELGAAGVASAVTALAPAGLWAEDTMVRTDRGGRTLVPLLRIIDPVVPCLVRIPGCRRAALTSNVAHPERVPVPLFLSAVRAVGAAQGYAACDRAMVGTRFADGARLAVPATVVLPEGDRILPAPAFQDVSELPAEVRVVRVPDAGHAVSWDQPELCVRMIRETESRWATPPTPPPGETRCPL